MLSSAKLQILASFTANNRSFTKMLNKIGPGTDPWGTPSKIVRNSLTDEQCVHGVCDHSNNS